MKHNNFLKNITSVYTDKSINGWLRGLIWVGTIVVVYVGGKAIYRLIVPTDEQKKAKQDYEHLMADLSNSVKNNPLTYPITQYNQWATQITDAFSGCDYSDINPVMFSDSYETVASIFKKLNSDSDYLQLVNSFGIKNIKKDAWCGGNYENVDLPTAIGKQLNRDEIEGLFLATDKGLNEILKSKNIKYRITVI